MATPKKAYYKHHERDNDTDLIASLKTREIGLSTQGNKIIGKTNAGGFFHWVRNWFADSVSYATFGAALTDIGATSKELIVTTAVSITANTTVPSNVHLKVAKGGSFTIASGITLTINGSFEAGNFQVFAGDGSVAGLKKANIKWFGAVGDGVTDDATAINKAIATQAIVYAPKGTYLTGSQITLNYSTAFYGAGQGQTIILSDHTGTAFKIATNNRPHLADFKISRNTVGALGSRTGIGLDVYGDFAGGSSVQAHVERVWIQGFSVGLQLEACFLSSFYELTLKQNDTTYKFKNNTNDSILFFGCKSNLSIKQHLYADGGAAECGGTFYGCEFEGAFYFPAFEVVDATSGFGFTFTDCYAKENNEGSFAGSSLNLWLSNVPGELTIKGGGWSAGGMNNARIFYFRNTVGSVIKYRVNIETALTDTRGSGAGSAPVDMDSAILTDFTHFIRVKNCYRVGTGTPYPTICDRDDTQYNNEFFGNAKLKGIKLLNHTGSEVIDSDSSGNVRLLGSTYLRNHWVHFDGSISWHIWVGPSGQLRIKNGAPSSAGDGDPIAYIIPKLQIQVLMRSLLAADYGFQQWLDVAGFNLGETQLGSGLSTAVFKWGTGAASADFAYSALDSSAKSFTVTGLSPNMVIPRSNFTVGGNTYTVINSDATKVYVVEDNSAEAATGTLTGLKTVTMKAVIDANGYLGIGGLPSFMLHLFQNSSNDMNFKFETPKANGLVQGILQNDARQWILKVDGASSTDDFVFRDATSGINALTIIGGTGRVLALHPTGGIGYGTGAGGTVTQATSKATGVTLSKVTGQITLNNANLAADTTVSFTLTNTAIAATDVLALNHISGGTPGSYLLNARCAAGSAVIDVRNITGGALAEAIVLQFVLIKGVTS